MKKIYLFFLFFLLYTFNAFADHMHSTDIGYRQIGHLKYEVNITIYRDCRGIPLTIPALTVQNDSFKVTTTLTRVKIEDIIINCKTKNCSPSNTMVGNMGFEAHYLKDTIDFNTGVFTRFISKKYCQVVFAMSECCRNGSIAIFASGNMYSESMLDLCYAQNDTLSTGDFVNNIMPLMPINQANIYSFRVMPVNDRDSVSYELVKAKNDYKSEEYYGVNLSWERPFTDYCIPTGSKCKAVPGAFPPRGTYFSKENGNLILTPTYSGEVSVIVCRVNYYRKDSGRQKLVGYALRDMQSIAISTPGNMLPNITKLGQTFLIKSRTEQCFDFDITDDSIVGQKRIDTITVSTPVMPRYGSLRIIDSTAREKTLHYCWQPTDQDYLKGREDNFTLKAYDNSCSYRNLISTTYNFKVLPPDSFTNINIRTYLDANRNGKKDANETYRPAKILVNKGGSYTVIQTNTVGYFAYKPLYGNFIFSINRNAFYYASSADITLNAKFDSTYSIELGFINYQGLRGRAYEDVNNNCTYEVGTDQPLQGFKITSSNRNAAALTDANGEYLLNSNTGSISFNTDANSPFYSTCNTGSTATIVADSQFASYDFPVKRKTTFTDAGIVHIPAELNKNSRNRVIQQIVVNNYNNFTIKNVPVVLQSSRKLYGLKSTRSFASSLDTVYWTIDSIQKNAAFTIQYSHHIHTDSVAANDKFNKGDEIQYKVWLKRSDNNTDNNYFSLTETVSDTCCISQKNVYASPSLYPVNPEITYRVYLKPSVTTYRAYLTDLLDKNRFDLNSLRIIKTSESLSTNVYINDNKLVADVYKTTFIQPTELIFSLKLITPLTDTFTIDNNASADFDHPVLVYSNTVRTHINSPITYPVKIKDTVCAGSNIALKFKTWYTPDKDNHFKIFLSDSNGSFANATEVYDTASNATDHQAIFTLPSIYASHKYKLKVKGTLPSLEAFASIALPEFTLNPAPKGQLTDNRINGGICNGDSLRIKTSGAASYSFYKNGTALTPFTANTYYKDIVNNVSVYKVAYKSDKGCIVYSSDINTTPLTLPKITATANDTLLCQGENAQFMLSGGSKYTLLNKSGTIVDTAITGTSYQWKPAGGYQQFLFRGSGTNGCTGNSNITGIRVYASPAVPVITRIAKSLQSSSAVAYQWYSSTGKIDTATNRSFYPKVDGTYYVIITDANGCTRQSADFLVNYTTVSAFHFSNAIQLYPNPANDLITIKSTRNATFSYVIKDVSGRQIMNGYADGNNALLNTSHLATGQYVASVITAEGIVHIRFVIAH